MIILSFICKDRIQIGKSFICGRIREVHFHKIRLRDDLLDIGCLVADIVIGKLKFVSTGLFVVPDLEHVLRHVRDPLSVFISA